MKKKSTKRFIAMLIVLCMAISIFSVPVVANETDTQSTSDEAVLNSDNVEVSDKYSDSSTTDTSTTDTPMSGDTDTPMSDNTDTEKDNDYAIDSATMTDDANTEDIAYANSVEDEDTLESDNFEETGFLDCNVIDANGTRIDAWYDDTTDTYYMFLTSACSISDITLNITGLRIANVSAGTLDQSTNTVTGAFAKSGDSITLTDKNGDSYNVVAMQSGLPSINISLNGVDLDTINGGSKSTKYKNNTVIITDAEGNINVSESEKVEIKGRGNSTWNWSDKKPYQIKFDKKQSVLGMAKAKKWILLANAFDDSMLKNKTAFYMAERLNMEYSPDYEYADLWIDGDYRGTYMIGEKIEIDDNRLNLTDDNGLIMEYDSAFYASEDYSFYDSYLKNYFTLQEAVNEDTDEAIRSSMNLFQKKLDSFMSFLTSANLSNITLNQLNKYIDVDSFARWYLVSEYLGNHEAFVSSWFWYTDEASDVLHLGPVWDFDSSQIGSIDVLYGKQVNYLFNNLLKIPSFSNYLNKIYSDNKAMISGLSSYAYNVAETISASANMNYIRWKFLGQKNQKRSESNYFANTYDEAVSTLLSWYKARYEWFDSNMTVYPSALLDYSLSTSGQTLTIKATDIRGTNSLSAAVWSKTNGQDDLKWYNFSGDDKKSLIIDFSLHGGSDTYIVHVYAGSTCISTWVNQVEMNTTGAALTAQYSDDYGAIDASMNYADDYSNIQFAVWSDANGQDDLRWYNVNTDSNGTASMSISPIVHNSCGKYYIHAYGQRNGKWQFITATEVNVPEEFEAGIKVEKKQNINALQINVNKTGGFSSLSAAVWGSKGGQNDLEWFDLTKDVNETYTGICDLDKHGEIGKYNIHIYGKYNGKNVFIGSATYDIDELKKPFVTVDEISEGETLKISLFNSGAYSSVSFAVWGDVNGQNDLEWYAASKDNAGCWSTSVNLLNHREIGTYNIHVYAKQRGGTDKYLLSYQYDLKELNTPYLDCNISSSGKILKSTIYDAENYSNIKLAVWSEKNGQDDLKWYNAGKKTDNSWLSSINLALHGDTGIYNIHAYGISNGKLIFLTSQTITVDEFLSPSLVAVENTGHILALAAKNAEDYSSISFAVWTAENGQDDLKWYKANKYSNGIWRYSVNTKNHFGNGTYIIHAYGTKNGIFSYLTSATLVIKSYPDSIISTHKSDDSNILSVVVDPAFGYDSASAAIWCDANGQNDLKWYSLTKNSDGTFSTSVDLGRHAETGNYLVHIYASYNGITCFDGSANISVTEIIAPKILLENSNNSLKISCANIAYCNNVSFAIWNDENGQDDLKWYAGSKLSDGTWTCEASTAIHGETGNYHIHIYCIENGKHKFVTSDMIAA